MKIILIDDEHLARMELRRLLAVYADCEIVAEAANIEEAQRAIEEHKPDLIFLDVQMPDGSGFDLLDQLESVPEVIFTTAFDSYALRAFEVNALDYLQKPISAERLTQALKRVRSKINEAKPALLASSSKIFIKDGERCWLVALEKIALFESEGNYTRVYFDQHRPLLLRSLNQLEQRLDATQFIRASRRFIVNLQFVEHIGPSAASGLVFTLQNGLSVEMSRRRAAEFKELSRI
ncbi:LytR/AlgR family response regulator transcription factor [Solimicrobium silvestre]|uniref:Response regulator of the LytR/AlgR family n=1 Tax=Solimicrobium silvestre TaxID=2099400 RepID=A0A2S9H1G9_9BURK|nr:LytTR family DNA-binding domain-containing protein [Solimicrobium silvestre]PRC93835.1 Response regulator of the LytR/AlgR family [Solimicrobium silvestre]